MQRCSNRAYAKCPDRHLCGHIEEADFTEDSECAAFNREVESQPMTNGDKIRAMSDEELSEFINCFSTCDCCVHDGDCKNWKNQQTCTDGVKKWLQLPAEGE